MEIRGKRIGVGITGSFCTMDKIFPELEQLKAKGAEVMLVFSETVNTTDSRFGTADSFRERARAITGRLPVDSIAGAEPIGPQKLLDIMVIMPCTGNTLAKLANGITDTSVLMAAKAHLRNNRPLVLAVSSNDALGMNMKNIGLLLNAKNIYFVPFGQDDPLKKGNSLTAHPRLLLPTLEAALDNRQYQPILEAF